MTLYHGEPNGPSLTVLAALFEKGLAPSLVYIDLAAGARRALPFASQAEVALSVEGEGPVLVVDGEGMSESVFIACYLDDVGSGPALRPAEPFARWELMAWCRQLTERTAPAAAFLGCQAFPPGMRPAVEPPDDVRRDCEAKIAQEVAKVEARLPDRDWLMGEFSIADLESYAWLAGMRALVPAAFADRPRALAWLARVRHRPSVVKALSLSRVPDPLKWWAPGPEINRWG